MSHSVEPTTSASDGELSTRTRSGIYMVVGASICILAGGLLSQLLAVFVSTMMTWELWRMLHSSEDNYKGTLISMLTGFILVGQMMMYSRWVLLLAIVPTVGSLWLEDNRLIFCIGSVVIQMNGLGIIQILTDHGASSIFWVLFVVVVTDICGYFAGKGLGGPKLCSISPSKTWSGTVVGWFGSALFGYFVAYVTNCNAPKGLICTSIVLSVASQLGDVAESLLKRHVGVKNSSNLIPGHGGFCDRFDGLAGAIICVFLITNICDVPIFLCLSP
jgi:phosphatidate cytidylyltransferase